MKTNFNTTKKLPLWLSIWAIVALIGGILALILGLIPSTSVFNKSSSMEDHKSLFISYDLSLTATGQEDDDYYTNALVDVCNGLFKEKQVNYVDYNVNDESSLGGSIEFIITQNVSDDVLLSIGAGVESAAAKNALLAVNGTTISAFEYRVATAYEQPAYNYIWRAVISGASILALATVYVLIRYSVSMGLATLIAGVGDVAITMALAIILRVPVSTTFAVMMVYTVLYSVLNSLAAFSPVRKLLKTDEYKEMEVGERMAKAFPAGNVCGIVLASVTVVVGAILAIFCGEAIRVSGLCLVISAIACLFSTICVKPALVTAFSTKWLKMKEKRMAARSVANK